jgi:hypothetical protein
MPTPYIQKLAKEGHGSVQHLEKKWDEAKSKAAEQGHAEDYALVTTIFKKLVNASVIKNGQLAFKIQAKARLQADKASKDS